MEFLEENTFITLGQSEILKKNTKNTHHKKTLMNMML